MHVIGTGRCRCPFRCTPYYRRSPELLGRPGGLVVGVAKRKVNRLATEVQLLSSYLDLSLSSKIDFMNEAYGEATACEIAKAQRGSVGTSRRGPRSVANRELPNLCPQTQDGLGWRLPQHS